jgi:hypothetical protein
MKYLHIECHLAAKTGTNLAVSGLVGAILDDVSYVVVSLLFDFLMGFHHVEMISFL